MIRLSFLSYKPSTNLKSDARKMEHQTDAETIAFLRDLCNKLMSDGLRNGSSVAAKCMADRKRQLRSK